jgi:hypothetical protein
MPGCTGKAICRQEEVLGPRAVHPTLEGGSEGEAGT